VSVGVHGILLFDKPYGLTSAAAVARLKRLYGAAKVGHMGSLDPLATGLLAICFGEATKFGSHLLDADKEYRVGVRLGERTLSADLETEVCERAPVPDLGEAQMREALAAFPRRYQQVPPMHSAIKQGGKPLYSYARAGITLQREAREVLIHGLTLLNWTAPALEFDVTVSKGTYIRVLAEDIAVRLGTVGHLTALRRLRVAPFDAEPMTSLAELETLDPAGRLQRLLPTDAALTDVPRLDVDFRQAAELMLGRSTPVAADSRPRVRIYGPEERFLGLGEVQDDGMLVPRRLIAASESNRA
jgi:tRNA pseudouridine55 synthase